MVRYHRSLLTAFVVGIAASGCQPGAYAPPVVHRVVIAEGMGTIVLEAIGDTLRLTAVPVNALGRPVQAAISWRSASPSVLSVDPTGLVTTVGFGLGTIQAEADGIVGSARFLVTSRADTLPGR